MIKLADIINKQGEPISKNNALLNPSKLSLDRISYQANEMEYKSLWFQIAKDTCLKKPTDKLILTTEIVKIWNEMIKYLHNDLSSEFDPFKSIFLHGNTGSGKTSVFEIALKYIRVNNLMYLVNGAPKSMGFPIVSSKEIVKAFEMNGYAGIQNFINYRNILIDDLGSEVPYVMHFGTKINVIEEVIEERYRKIGFTHITSNFSLEEIRVKYGDRVYSRLKERCNEYKLVVNDVRLTR